VTREPGVVRLGEPVLRGSDHQQHRNQRERDADQGDGALWIALERQPGRAHHVCAGCHVADPLTLAGRERDRKKPEQAGVEDSQGVAHDDLAGAGLELVRVDDADSTQCLAERLPEQQLQNDVVRVAGEQHDRQEGQIENICPSFRTAAAATMPRICTPQSISAATTRRLRASSGFAQPAAGRGSGSEGIAAGGGPNGVYGAAGFSGIGPGRCRGGGSRRFGERPVPPR